MSQEKIKIVIQVEGGVVRSVHSSLKDAVDVEIWDFDDLADEPCFRIGKQKHRYKNLKEAEKDYGKKISKMHWAY